MRGGLKLVDAVTSKGDARENLDKSAVGGGVAALKPPKLRVRHPLKCFKAPMAVLALVLIYGHVGLGVMDYTVRGLSGFRPHLVLLRGQVRY